MKSKKAEIDKTKEIKGIYEAKAIELARLWAKYKLQGYQEPERAGTPKGSLIGLSSQKYKAALLQVLFPALPLKEIAKFVGVSEGVLKYWRTENQFLEVVRQTSAAFGEGVADTIIALFFKDMVGADFSKSRTTFTIGGVGKDEADTVRFLINAIPFYSDIVTETIAKTFKANLEQTPDLLRWGMLLMSIQEAATVHDDKSKREFERRPEIMLLIKFYISELIDLLADPKTREQLSSEKIQELVELIKHVVFNRLDALAQ